MFEALVTRPIFNLLVGIYGVLPGHDFGITIIIFTIIVRLLLWPQSKRQFEATRKIRKIQPEIKELREKHKNDRRAQQMAIADLYRKHGIRPMASIGNMIIQIPIIFGLYQAVRKLSADNNVEEIARLSYSFVKDLPFVEGVINGSQGISQQFLGIIDLTESGWDSTGIYLPLIFVAIAAAGFQYLQTKMAVSESTTNSSGRSLRQILRDEASGNQASQSEINAATTQSMVKLMPLLTLFLGATFPGSIAFYWMFSGAITFLLQKRLRSNSDSNPQPVVKYKSSLTDKPKKTASNKSNTRKKSSTKKPAKKSGAKKTRKKG